MSAMPKLFAPGFAFMWRLVFFMLPLAREHIFYYKSQWASNDELIYIILQESKQRQQYFEHHKMQGVARVWWPRNNETLNMLLIARMMATCVLFMLYCKEWQQPTMVDCNKGAWDCAKQQPAKFWHCIKEASNDCELTTLMKGWSMFCVIHHIARS